MQRAQLTVFMVLAIVVLLACVGVYAFTQQLPVLFLPLFLLFAAIAVNNWQGAWWVMLATVPLSIQISFNADTLSLTLPDEPMMWLFLGLFVLGAARQPNLLPEWWWRNKIVWLVIVQFLWLLVAVCFSQVLFFSVKFAIAKTWQLVCMFLLPIFILRGKNDLIRAFFVLFIPILATVLVIVSHHALLSFRFDMVQRAMTDLYCNHVDYSTVISVFFPLLLVAHKLVPSQNHKNLLKVVIIVFLIAIYLSYARAAVIAVAFSLVVGLFIKVRAVNVIMPAMYALIFIMLVYLVHNNKFLDYKPDYDKTSMHSSFREHMIATIRGNDMSSRERIYRWIAAIRMSTEKPLTGYGPHGFYYHYKRFAVSSFRTWVSSNDEHSTTHNYFLYMLTEQGWPAMLLYALLIPFVFAKCQWLYHRCADAFYKAAILGIGMMIAANFINNFFSELLETHKVGALFYIPLAALVMIEQRLKTEDY